MRSTSFPGSPPNASRWPTSQSRSLGQACHGITRKANQTLSVRPRPLLLEPLLPRLHRPIPRRSHHCRASTPLVPVSVPPTTPAFSIAYPYYPSFALSPPPPSSPPMQTSRSRRQLSPPPPPRRTHAPTVHRHHRRSATYHSPQPVPLSMPAPWVSPQLLPVPPAPVWVGVPPPHRRSRTCTQRLVASTPARDPGLDRGRHTRTLRCSASGSHQCTCRSCPSVLTLALTWHRPGLGSRSRSRLSLAMCAIRTRMGMAWALVRRRRIRVAGAGMWRAREAGHRLRCLRQRRLFLASVSLGDILERGQR
ncbi:hypothetical protein C8R45DRAFT_301569 [Mycena sanguinolenta]|nr:hypothetical protein C8R45DRAFT_301569 [Mycena sanguinolenta]